MKVIIRLRLRGSSAAGVEINGVMCWHALCQSNWGLSEASGHTSTAEAPCALLQVKKGPLAWNAHSKPCARTVLSKPFSAATHRCLTWPLSRLRPWRQSVCSCVINAWILLIPFKRICFRLLLSLSPRGASYSRPLHLISSVYSMFPGFLSE